MNVIKDAIEKADEKEPPETSTEDTSGEVKKPIVKLIVGKRSQIVKELETAILENNKRQGTTMLFQRDGLPVRIRPIGEANKKDTFGRPPQAPGIFQCGRAFIMSHLSEVADIVKYSKTVEDWLPADVTADVANYFLDARGLLRFPILHGTQSTPILRTDFTLLQSEGYDSQSGLYLDFDGVKFPMISEKPTDTESANSIERIIRLLDEFPFVSEIDKSVALSMILTAVIRRVLPTAPAFAISATSPGSGKTYLVDCCLMLAYGYQMQPIPWARDSDEQRKRLAAISMANPASVIFDNTEISIGGESLCAFLTSATFQDRILGKSETMTGTTNVLIAFTGNNLIVRDDAARRFLLCQLDAKRDRPEERVFDNPNLIANIQRERPQLVTDVLTWLRGYLSSKNDKPDLSPYGSFVEWSALIRSALVWAGFPDPCKSRESIDAKDTSRAELAEILRIWHDAAGDSYISVKQALDVTVISDFFKNLDFAGKTGKSADVSAKSVGRWLAKREGRVINVTMDEKSDAIPLRFERNSAKSDNVWKYRVGIVKSS